MSYRKKPKVQPKPEEKIDDPNQSLFAKTMKIHEETMKCHQETDNYLRYTKRAMLLKILQKIKENPPPFLTDSQSAPKMTELDQTIQELSRIIEQSKK